MKPEPLNDPPEDKEFISSLRQLTLRPPPAKWREEVLAVTAAAPPAPVRWYRSPFWRSMAALWAVLLCLWVDTLRLKPAATGGPVANAPSVPPLFHESMQSVLASLDRSSPHHPSFTSP